MEQDDWWIEIASKAIQEAVSVSGSQSKLARGLRDKHPKVSQQRVFQWLQRGYAAADGGICITIEEITGVPRTRLRPDVYPEQSNCDEPLATEGTAS